jgi:hypothetical protein
LDHYAIRGRYAAGVEDDEIDWRALNRANWDDRVPVSVGQYRLTSAGLWGLRE